MSKPYVFSNLPATYIFYIFILNFLHYFTFFWILGLSHCIYTCIGTYPYHLRQLQFQFLQLTIYTHMQSKLTISQDYLFKNIYIYLQLRSEIEVLQNMESGRKWGGKVVEGLSLVGNTKQGGGKGGEQESPLRGGCDSSYDSSTESISSRVKRTGS